MGCSTASTKDNSNIKSTLVALDPQTEPNNINLNPNHQSRNIKETSSFKSIDPEPNKAFPEDNEIKATTSSPPSTARSCHRMSMIKKKSSDLRKSECNGVVIVENLKDYLPENITKEDILQMVENALANQIEEDESKVVRGKTVSRRQVEAIADIVYLRLKDEDNEDKPAIINSTDIKKPIEKRRTRVRHSCINQLFVTVGMRDLSPELLKETCFKGKEVTELQIENAMKNISQGMKDVKVLTIDIR